MGDRPVQSGGLVVSSVDRDPFRVDDHVAINISGSDVCGPDGLFDLIPQTLKISLTVVHVVLRTYFVVFVTLEPVG